MTTEESADEPAWLAWAGRALATSATLVLAVLGWNRVAEDSFWVDEASTVMITGQSFGETWRLLTTQELNGSPYYLLMHLWLKLGDSEAFVRSLSLIFAVATAPLAYAIGRKLFGTVAGIVAAALLAVNGFLLSFAQEARQYSFALFLSALGTYLLIVAVERRRWWLWGAYAVVGALSVYAHMFGGFVMLGHALSLLGRRWHDLPWRQIVASYAGVAVLLIPVALFVMNNDRGQIDWLPGPSPTLLGQGFEEITGYAGTPMLWAYGIATAMAVVAMVVSYVREGSSRRSWGLLVCLLWFLAPILLGYAVSFTKPIFYPRYIIISVAGMALVAAGGLTFLRPRVVALIPAAVMVWLALPGITTYYNEPKADWRGTTDFVLQNARPGDAVIFFSPTGRRPFEYYLRLAGIDEANALTPIHPPTPFGEYDADTFLDFMAKDTVAAEFVDVGRDHPRIWVLLSKVSFGKSQEVLRAVAQRCSEVVPHQFQSVRVRLLHGCS